MMFTTTPSPVLKIAQERHGLTDIENKLNTMFAARANQENAIYEQQTAAAAKSLSQGTKAPPPKTPANKAFKTPFKIPLNDENAAFGAAKTGGKGKQDALFGEGKSTKLDKNAFVTPAGPRNRAPLGNKTTNAKATAFQTPAPLTQEKQSAKQGSPRLRRAKIKVHEAEAAAAESDDDLPEIEYMPPREVPLPDHPDDWPHDRTYPQFEGTNLTRGWWSEFAQQKDDDDDTDFSDFEQKLKLVEARDQQVQQGKKSPVVKKSGAQKATSDPLTAKPPQTLKSKNAASALAYQSKSTVVPSFAAPTAATKSRLPSALASRKVPARSHIPAGNPHHGAARVASNTTLGYSKGRAVSASNRTPVYNIYGGQDSPAKDRQESPAKTSLHELFGLADGLDMIDDGEDDLGGGVALEEERDEALENFQLETIE